MHLSMQRVGLLNGDSIELEFDYLKSKRLERTDGDEVSGRVFYYIPSSNLLFCGNCSVIYDETYSVIYDVIDDKIMQKSRASLERF